MCVNFSTLLENVTKMVDCVVYGQSYCNIFQKFFKSTCITQPYKQYNQTHPNTNASWVFLFQESVYNTIVY